MWGQGEKVLQVQRGCLGRAACYTRVSLASSANFLPYLLVKEGSPSPGEEGKCWAELSVYPSSKWYPAHLMLLEGILFNSRGRKAFLVCLLLLDRKSGNARYWWSSFAGRENRKCPGTVLFFQTYEPSSQTSLLSFPLTEFSLGCLWNHF